MAKRLNHDVQASRLFPEKRGLDASKVNAETVEANEVETGGADSALALGAPR